MRESRRSASVGSRQSWPDRLLDVREAAAMLSLTPATLYDWAYKRRLPVVKLSGPRGPLRFRLSVLEDLIRRAEQPALLPKGVDRK